ARFSFACSSRGRSAGHKLDGHASHRLPDTFVPRLSLGGPSTSIALAILLYGVRSSAQPPELEFGPATATFTRDFALVGSVREMPDGSLLVSDPSQNAVVLLDPRSGKVTQVGSSGPAANQYQSVRGGLVRTRGDTTLLYDAAASALLTIRTGTFASLGVAG